MYKKPVSYIKYWSYPRPRRIWVLRTGQVLLISVWGRGVTKFVLMIAMLRTWSQFLILSTGRTKDHRGSESSVQAKYYWFLCGGVTRVVPMIAMLHTWSQFLILSTGRTRDHRGSELRSLSWEEMAANLLPLLTTSIEWHRRSTSIGRQKTSWLWSSTSLREDNCGRTPGKSIKADLFSPDNCT